MSTDFELSNWRAEWQAQVDAINGVPLDMRGDALKQQRRLRAAHILELLAGILLLLGSAEFAWKVRSAESLLWAAVVWVTTLIASAFSIWNWHTLWRDDLKSVAEYADIYEKRCLARMRATSFGKRFVVVQALISGPWLMWDYYRGELSTTRFGVAIILLIALSLGYWIWFSRTRRSAARELHAVQTIRNVSEDE